MQLGVLVLATALMGAVAPGTCGQAAEETVPVTFRVPPVRRAEGRLTLEYEGKAQTVRQEWAFSEAIDSETRRSKLSIGWVTHQPNVYYARGETVVTKSPETGRWQQLEKTSQAPVFVPEIEWFLKLTYTEEELRAALPVAKSHHVGPSGILLMLSKHRLAYNRAERHRNIDCQVLTDNYSRAKAPTVLLENYMPQLRFLDSRIVSFFTIRETARGVKDEDGLEFTARLTLDYFYTETIDKKDARQLEQLELDLNLPLGAGLAEFFKPYKLAASSESFTMTYEEAHDPAGQLTSVAYDHNFNYLRKERVASSVSVWDLNEDLLYHVDLNYQGRLINSVDVEVPLEQCAVLSFENETPGKSGAEESGDSSGFDRPYSFRGTSLKLINFLGASRLVYMGRATVRDLPCAVYENIQAEPPHVFQLNLMHRQLKKASQSMGSVDGHDEHEDYDFIVQYFLLETEHTHAGVIEGLSESDDHMLLSERFWPARINLFTRHKASGATALTNSLEIHDFHLGLHGWTLKPSHLFMMPQCFDDEDEQLRLALELDFQPMGPDVQRQMALSKYKLEFDLMNELFRSLELSRLHMTEYNFAVRRPGQVEASFVISDRLEDRRVSFFGEGELPKSDAYLNNRIELQSGQQYTTESCLLGAAHIKDVALVIHCPAELSKANTWPTCTAIFGETQPVVKLATGREVPCQAFLFEAREPPKSALKSLESHQQALRDFEFKFDTVGGKGIFGQDEKRQTVGRVRDFEVTRQQQLITINNYRFAFPAAGSEATPATTTTTTSNGDRASESEAAGAQASGAATSNVRHFGSLAYDSVGDCARVCNLDANCRSYSYCRRDTASQPTTSYDKLMETVSGVTGRATESVPAARADPAGVRCVLSSLDLRANQVDKQLVNARVDSDKRLEVRDRELAAKQSPLAAYKLEMVSGCDIYERDILSVFSQTDELVRVDARLAEKVPSASSVSECARSVIALEAKSSDFSGASFAFCPRTGSCLSDEALYGSVEFKGPASGYDNDDDDDAEQPDAAPNKQLACELYRKRYQTYFRLSPRVLRRTHEQGDERPAIDRHAGGVKSIDLSLGTVEECARACWQSFGHVCLSFDYCSPGLCSVNTVAEETGDLDASALEYETRAGCLGYQRDLRWDHLRRAHLIGSHSPLGVELAPAHSRGRGIFLNLVLLCLSAALFAAGLVVGRLFSDQLEIATSTRRSQPSHSEANSSRGGGFASFLSGGNSSSSLTTLHNGRRNGERLSTNSKFNIENEIYEDPDAIGLEDLGNGGGGGGGGGTSADDFGTQTPEQRGDAGADDFAAPVVAPTEQKPTDNQRRAGYIDIPALL